MGKKSIQWIKIMVSSVAALLLINEFQCIWKQYAALCYYKLKKTY